MPVRNPLTNTLTSWLFRFICMVFSFGCFQYCVSCWAVLLWILDRHLVIIDMWTNAHIGDMHKKHRYVHIQIEFIFGTFRLFW